MMKKNLLNSFILSVLFLLLVGFGAGCYDSPGYGGCDDGSGNTGGDVVVDTTAECCADCICRNDEPVQATYSNGPYQVGNYVLPSSAYRAGATVYYPTNAQPPFAGLVYCPPFTGVQAMLAAWGPFFASHGIVLVTLDTSSTSDQVDSRDDQQRAVLEALKAEDNRSGSPLYNKLSSRFGVMGWSMGGGATWINAATVPDLYSAMSLAGHNATAGNTSKGDNIMCPTLILNGADDTTILGGQGQSPGVYGAIDNDVPKIIYEVDGKGHMDWMTPTSAGNDVAILALAFQKTFLEGDTRWGVLLDDPPANIATWEHNLTIIE